MAGIGITPDDLGIDGTSDNRTVSTSRTTRKDSEYPKEYDFTLELALYGSWRNLRDAPRVPAEYAFEDAHREPPLWFALYWGPTENENEESIKAALTGLRYDEILHDAFHEHLCNLATNECTPEDVLAEFIKDPDHWYTLLANPSLGPEFVREIHAAIKDDEFGPRALVEGDAKLPEDVLLELASRDYGPLSEIPWWIQYRHDMTEEILFALIGKCAPQDLVQHAACTDRVRDAIERGYSNGDSLSLADRERVTTALKRVRSALKTGRTGGIVRRRGGELALLQSVQTYPEISVGLAQRVLRSGYGVETMGQYTDEDQWILDDLRSLGLPTGWSGLTSQEDEDF